jgi:Holliday junction resolvase-like predicted endonuclease
MSYFIVAVVFAIIGFVGCFLIYRNNACKIGEIDKIIKEGDFSAATVQKINDVITGECKPKDGCGC